MAAVVDAGGGRRGRLWVALLVLAMGFVACGTTIDPSPGRATEPAARDVGGLLVAPSRAPSVEGTEEERATPDSGATTPDNGLAGTPSAVARPTSPGTSGSPGDAASPGQPDTGPRCSVPVAPGTPGVTADEIAIGAPRPRNLATLAVEAGEEPPAHQLPEYFAAMLDHVNAAGGIACRQVRVVWHDIDLADPGMVGPAGEQAMCATWTQDHSVFAAFPGGSDFPYEVLYACLDRAGVSIIDVRGLEYRDTEALNALPRLISLTGVRVDRGMEALVHALVRQGVLTSDAAIGVVFYDEP